jgi:acetyltransferase-like isoleucine patch superfamily enzyme
MAYGKKTSGFNLLTSIKIKFARMLVAGFPLNLIRVWGLKLCGFKVGKKVYIGNGLLITMFNAKTECDLTIGDRVAIAPRVTLVLASDANWSRLNQIFPPVKGKIVLENDCWIGTGAIILPNINIGEMSIVAAGSIVTKDVAPYTVVSGIPARQLRELQKI